MLPRRSLHLLPFPSPFLEVSDPDVIPDLRRLHCAHYDTCLDVAIAAHWPNWTCVGCNAYRRRPLDDLRADVHSFARLWTEAHAQFPQEPSGPLEGEGRPHTQAAKEARRRLIAERRPGRRPIGWAKKP